MMKNEEEATEAQQAQEPQEKRDDCSFMLPLLGAGVLAVPSWFAWQWLQAFLHGESHEQRLALFMAAFPEALRNPQGVVAFALVLAGAALLLGVAGRFLSRGFGKFASGIVVWGAVAVAVGLVFVLA